MHGNLPQAVVGQQSFIISIMKCLFVKKNIRFGNSLAVAVQLSDYFYILQLPGARLTRTIIVRPRGNKISINTQDTNKV